MQRGGCSDRQGVCRLTALQAGHSQSLGSVQSEPVLDILDVSHGRHRVEVGLKRKFMEISSGLNL